MTNYLPKHATVPEACEWLATETGEPWTLARLLENSLTPWVWLDYEPRFPEIFGDRLEGFITPMLFHGDVVRMAAGGDGVLLTMIRTPDKGITRVMPGYRAGIDDLRFLGDDITRLAGKMSAPHHESLAAYQHSEKLPVSVVVAEMENDPSFVSKAMQILSLEDVGSTYSPATAVSGLINHWMVNRDLACYIRNERVDVTALTVLPVKGGFEALENWMAIDKEELGTR